MVIGLRLFSVVLPKYKGKPMLYLRGVLYVLKSLFDLEMYVVSTEKKPLGETINLSTHNIGFKRVLTEILWK